MSKQYHAALCEGLSTAKCSNEKKNRNKIIIIMHFFKVARKGLTVKIEDAIWYSLEYSTFFSRQVLLHLLHNIFDFLNYAIELSRLSTRNFLWVPSFDKPKGTISKTA